MCALEITNCYFQSYTWTETRTTVCNFGLKRFVCFGGDKNFRVSNVCFWKVHFECVCSNNSYKWFYLCVFHFIAKIVCTGKNSISMWFIIFLTALMVVNPNCFNLKLLVPWVPGHKFHSILSGVNYFPWITGTFEKAFIFSHI